MAKGPEAGGARAPGAERSRASLAKEAARAAELLNDMRSMIDVAQLSMAMLDLSRRVAALEDAPSRAPAAAPFTDSPAAPPRSARDPARLSALESEPRIVAPIYAHVADEVETPAFLREAPASPRSAWRGSTTRVEQLTEAIENVVGRKIVGRTPQATFRRQRRIGQVLWGRARNALVSWTDRYPLIAPWVHGVRQAAAIPLTIIVLSLVVKVGILHARIYSQHQYREVSQSSFTSEDSYGQTVSTDGLKAGYIFDDVFEAINGRDFADLAAFEGARSPFSTYVNSSSGGRDLPSFLKSDSLNNQAFKVWSLGLNARFDEELRRNAKAPQIDDLLDPGVLGLTQETVRDLAYRGQCYALQRLASEGWQLAIAQHGPRLSSERSDLLLLAAVASDFDSCVTDHVGFLNDIDRLKSLSDTLRVQVQEPVEAKTDDLDAAPPASSGVVPLAEEMADSAPVAAPLAELPIRTWYLVAPQALGQFAEQRKLCADPSWRSVNGPRGPARAYMLGVLAARALEFDRADACLAMAAESPLAPLRELATFMRGRILFWGYSYGQGTRIWKGEERDERPTRCGRLNAETCAIVERSVDDLDVLFSRQPAPKTIALLEQYAKAAPSPALNGDLLEYIRIVRGDVSP